MKFNWWKLGAIIIALICLGLVGKVVWDDYSHKKVQDQLNSELMKANLEIGKAHTEFADASDKIKELNKKLQAEIKAHEETVVQYNELWARYDVLVHGNSSPIPPSGETVVHNEDIFQPGTIYLAVDKRALDIIGETISFGHDDTRLHINATLLSYRNNDSYWSLTGKVDYQLHLNIKLKSVTTIAPTGAVNNYAELYEVDNDGKELGKFTITKFESVVTDQRKPRFYLWSPHLDIGILGGVTTGLHFKAAGTLGLSIAGYGLTKNDLTWRFVRIGANLGDTIGLDFVPVMWNVAEPIPLISNLWIGPFVSFDAKKQVGLGLSLSVVL